MERRREHNAMPEGERLFQSLLDAAAIGIAVEDLEGRPLFANPALCSMLGFTEAELCSEALCRVLSPRRCFEGLGSFSSNYARAR